MLARPLKGFFRIARIRVSRILPDLLIYLMDYQHGLSRADLVPLLGTPSRVSEVLRASAS